MNTRPWAAFCERLSFAHRSPRVSDGNSTVARAVLNAEKKNTMSVGVPKDRPAIGRCMRPAVASSHSPIATRYTSSAHSCANGTQLLNHVLGIAARAARSHDRLYCTHHRCDGIRRSLGGGVPDQAIGEPFAQSATFVLTILTLSPDLPSPREAPPNRPERTANPSHKARCIRRNRGSQRQHMSLLMRLTNSIISTSVGVNTFSTKMLLALTTNCDGGALLTTQHNTTQSTHLCLIPSAIWMMSHIPNSRGHTNLWIRIPYPRLKRPLNLWIVYCREERGPLGVCAIIAEGVCWLVLLGVCTCVPGGGGGSICPPLDFRDRERKGED